MRNDQLQIPGKHEEILSRLLQNRRLRKKGDFDGEERKNVPQGLRPNDFAGFVYGLKPVPTSPYLPFHALGKEFFLSL